MNLKFILKFSLWLLLLKCISSAIPVVLWHGMGDTCCFPFSLGSLKKLIEQNIYGVYVKSIKIGGSLIEDYKSGFFTNPNIQVKDACEQIKNDKNLAKGYNAIGFSQGGQFLRAIAQRCPDPPMYNLISMGGQHQGVFGLPKCPSLSLRVCEYMRKILHKSAYEKWIQEKFVQATYWHDPLNEDEYKKGSIFLAEINNEISINHTYIRNLNRLKSFVMVKFLNDSIVQPRESEWFEFYKPGQDKEIVPLLKSNIFLENRLGLKRMYNLGKLEFLECEEDHLRFSEDWFIKHIMPYLKNSN